MEIKMILDFMIPGPKILCSKNIMFKNTMFKRSEKPPASKFAGGFFTSDPPKTWVNGCDLAHFIL